MRDRMRLPIMVLCLLLCCGTIYPAVPAAAEGGLGEKELPPVGLVLALRQARIAEIEGRTDDALAVLREASEEFSDSVLPVVELLDFHRRHRLPEESGQELRELLKRRLLDPRSPLPSGTLRYLVDAPDATEAELNLFLEATLVRLGTERREPRLLAAAAALQERLGRLPEARETLGRLLEVQPSDPVRWHCLALDRKLERWQEVADFLRARLSAGSHFAERMSYIEILGKLGDLEEIVRQLDLLGESAQFSRIRQLGSLRSLLLQAAWDLRDAGRHDGAETIFRRVLQIEPDCAEARNALLYFYSTEEERRAHEAALAERWSAETDPDELAREGANVLAGGDAARAFELLQRAAQQLPGSEIAWFNLGLAAIRLERWSAAHEAMERATEINPSRAEAYLYRGAALQNLERCAEAIPPLEKALQLDPELDQAHYYLYFCHRALGHREPTRRHLELYNRSRAARPD